MGPGLSLPTLRCPQPMLTSWERHPRSRLLSSPERLVRALGSQKTTWAKGVIGLGARRDGRRKGISADKQAHFSAACRPSCCLPGG